MTIILSPKDIESCIKERKLHPGMEIKLTETALLKAQNLESSEPHFKNLHLRVYIEGKGCDGFYYGVTFDSANATDFFFTQGGLNIIVDPESLKFLYGSTVAWIQDDRGSGFLVENPQHERFRGKFYKKKSWIEALNPAEKPISSR